MMEVCIIARNAEEVPMCREAALEELKERLWREVWKESIDLPGARVKVEPVSEGYKITAEI